MKRTIRTILGLLLALGTLHAGFGGIQRKFLSPEEAFKVQAKMAGERIETTIKLGEKIHIYAKDLHFKVVKPEKFELQVKKPKPTVYEGDKVYYGTLKIPIPLSQIRQKVKGPFTLEVDLAGCSDAGICYQPQKYTFDFDATTTKSSEERGVKSEEPKEKVSVPAGKVEKNLTSSPANADEKGFFEKISQLSGEGNSGKIAKALADEGVVFILLLFFVAGLLLALTPCILPMIPILSSIIVKQAGKEGQVSRSTSFLISLCLLYTSPSPRD